MELYTRPAGELRARGTLEVVGHAARRAAARPAADVVLLDVGPPAPNAETLASLRGENDSALVIVVATEIDSHARELGASVEAVGYLKKGVAVARHRYAGAEVGGISQIKR